MLFSLFNLVIGTASDLLALAFLARFFMQWRRVSFRNPLGQFIQAVTDWAVLPMRKLVPGLFGLDLASLLLVWLVQSLFIGIVIGLSGALGGASAAGFGAAVLAGLIETARLALYLGIGVVIAAAVLSWVNPYAPVAPVFNQLAEPLLRPFRTLIPPIGGVDLSPLAALLLLQAGLLVLGYARGALLPFF